MLKLDLVSELKTFQEEVNRAIQATDDVVNRGNNFFRSIREKKDTTAVDSLKYYAAFLIAGGEQSNLNLPIFEDAQSSGRLGLLDDKELLKLYTLLLAQIADYNVFQEKMLTWHFWVPFGK